MRWLYHSQRWTADNHLNYVAVEYERFLRQTKFCDQAYITYIKTKLCVGYHIDGELGAGDLMNMFLPFSSGMNFDGQINF